ncbi:MAG TPA: serine/threonine-protein kinase, partial [Anaerolineaceae bacterium]|nr:serine/threonine-protein kinase [Anaerolineaceae bacterium]
IGRYHILEQLGQGGMATVYKAYDTRLEREVAVKVIRKEAFPAETHERIFKRFEREAKVLAHMVHPNIVKIYDTGEYSGSPFLVMEYLPGKTLKDQMNRPINYRQAARLLAPIAQALHYAHQRGILHRDVKPSNILLMEDKTPILTDFGIAKLLEDTESHTLTGTGVGIGTPEYMAPEQGLGSQIDGRADIYSLGVVFYELLTGKKPFQAETPLAVLLKQINDPLPRPKQFIPDLPDEVERVIFKALAKKPEDRYETMAAFVAALEGLVQIQPFTAPATQLSAQGIEQISPPPKHLPRQVHAQPAEPVTVDMLEPQQGIQPGEKKMIFLRWLLPAIVGVGILFFSFQKIFPIKSISNTTLTEPEKTTITSTSAAILPTGTTAVTLVPAATASVDLDMYTNPLLGPVPEGALMRLGKGTAYKAIFYPDGKTIAVASSLGIYLYNFETLDLINFFATEHPVTAISVSPDGTMLASALGDNTINLIDASSGKLLHTFEGHMYSSLAFSPDSSTLASATFDSNLIILWDASSGEKLRTLTGHTSGINSVAFSP